ncbi:MAG: hypothetical protein ACRCW6_01955 [Mycoplasmoidaceae bacterium]
MSNEFNTGSYQEEMGEELAEQQKINPAYQNESSYTEWELYTFDNINNSNKDAVIKLNTKTFLKITQIGYIKLLSENQASAIQSQEDVITNTSISIYKTYNNSYVFNPLFNKDINLFNDNIFLICQKNDIPIRDINMFQLLSKIEYSDESKLYFVRESIPLKDWFRIFKNCDADILINWQQDIQNTTITKIELLNKNQRILLSDFNVKGELSIFNNDLNIDKYATIPIEFERNDNVFPLWVKPTSIANNLRFYFPWWDDKKTLNPFSINAEFWIKAQSIYFHLADLGGLVLIPDNYYKIFLYNLATISANNLNFMSNGGLSPEFLANKQIKNINDYLYAMRQNTDAINVFTDFYLDACKNGGYWNASVKIPILDLNSKYYSALISLFKMCSKYCYSKVVYGGGLSESSLVLQPFYFDSWDVPVDYVSTFKTELDKNGNLNVVDINLPAFPPEDPLNSLDYKAQINSSYFNVDLSNISSPIFLLKNKKIKDNKSIKGNDNVYYWNELPILLQTLNGIDDNKQSLETNELNYLVFLGLGDIPNGINSIWRYLYNAGSSASTSSFSLDVSQDKQDISDKEKFKDYTLQILKSRGINVDKIKTLEIGLIIENKYNLVLFNWWDYGITPDIVGADIVIIPGGIPWGQMYGNYRDQGILTGLPEGKYASLLDKENNLNGIVKYANQQVGLIPLTPGKFAYDYSWDATITMEDAPAIISCFSKEMDFLELELFINAATNKTIQQDNNKFSFVLQKEMQDLGLKIVNVNEINISAIGYSLNNEIVLTYLKPDNTTITKSLIFNLNDKDNLKNTMTNIQII